MSIESAQQLVVLDRCNRAIAEAASLSELTDLRSRAEAIRIWAKSANESLEVQNRAAELRLLAERKAGKMLSSLRLKGGDRKSNGRDDRLKLSDLGITQNQSKRWQKEAAVPDQEFRKYVRTSTQLGMEITAAGLLRLACGAKHEQAKPSPATTTEVRDIRSARKPNDAMLARSLIEGGSGRMAESIEEALNHMNLLQQVIKPYVEGDFRNLTTGDRRAICYLLSEVNELLRAMHRQDEPSRDHAE